MRRTLYALLMIGLLLPALLMAQDTPLATEEPSVITGGEIIGDEAVQPIPPPPASQPVSIIDPQALPILINVRTDMELLANQALNNQRPVGWSGSIDVNDIQLPILMRLDLELLAGTILGADQRPDGWFGAVASTQYAISRDIRHDLELLADGVNSPNVRPPGWAGGDPLMRCDRSVQALVTLLERSGTFQLQIDLNALDFCQQAEVEASRFAEQGQANAAALAGAASSAPAAGSVQIDSPFAVAFLDRNARQPTGTVPQGEVITPVARSYTQFSRMMLIRGNGFDVFIDYRDSSITEDAFNALPDINSITTPSGCGAAWCTGGGVG
ncbi:MAG: hypothetical protein K8L97_24500 [Anaerolineae bacterium]|nr:hypothetical protein [Anaerolineae bacterium]